MTLKLWLAALMTFTVVPCALGRDRSQDPPTVPYVDLSRYMGEWYEIAALPQRFEAGCVASHAHYELMANGKVDVTNLCRLGSFSGKEKAAHGTARVVDKTTNARLKITFFWPFAGNYWILALADDYSYALVGSPDHKSLWILSRTPSLSAVTTQALLAQGQALGYPVDKVTMTPQPTLKLEPKP